MEHEIKFHQLAEILPLVTGAEFDELVESIKANGLREPIVLYEGSILDGRNRYRACLAAGVEPRTIEYDGADAAAFVRDENIHRRHLTSGQKAMAVAKYATMKAGAVTDQSPGSMSNKQAANLVGVRERLVQDAKSIIRRGTGDEINDVRSGKNGIKPTMDAIRARVKSASGFTTPAMTALKDETERLKTATLHNVMAAVFTARKYTPKQAAAVINKNKRFKRFADHALADKIEAFGSWVAQIACELRSQK
jgi:hypothetical protein